MLTFGVHSYDLFSWQYQNESHVINSFVVFWTYLFTREGAQMRHPVIEPFASECSSSVQSKPFRREPSILPPQVRSSKKYWDRVTHICVNELTILGPDNSLSHYLNHCWNIVNWTRNKNQWNLNRNSYIFIQEKCIWKCRLWNGTHFVSALMC